MAEFAPYAVLMVDDNVAMREALARSLARRGCRVATAASDVAGIEVLRRQAFDVVVTDLNMPVRGGLWLWRQALLLRPELRGRFVLVASEPLPEPPSLSLFTETERFLLKPVSLDTLWGQVEDIMQGAPTARATPRAQPPEARA